MTNYAGSLYELRLVADNDIQKEVEAWLEDVVRAAATQDGVENVRAFDSGIDDQGRSIRTCQIEVRDDHSIDGLVDGYFADIDADAAERFGDGLLLESRLLHPDQSHDLPANESPVCLNCGTRLRGQYCGICGQRSRTRLISIWQLLKEAFGDLLELDSRLWLTLGPLLSRPGRLTRDYLEGRRARYMPPFRTYLVLSVIFFIVAFFDPKEDLKILFEPEPPPTAEQTAALEDKARIANAAKDEQVAAAMEKLKALEADGKISEGVIAEIIDDDDGFEVSFGDDSDGSGFFDDCENASFSDEEDAPEWLKKRFTDEQVQDICERNKARGVDNFADAIVENVPVALIVLLPLMAMVLKLLYPLSRRYFVEHLLFFLHFHAFFFLILILQILFARFTGLFGAEDSALDSIATLILVIVSFYIPVYLYKAMRHVYGQGHLITIPKYLILVVAYLTGATFTMVGAFLVALLSA